jgi:hypothetical protein
MQTKRMMLWIPVVVVLLLTNVIIFHGEQERSSDSKAMLLDEHVQSIVQIDKQGRAGEKVPSGMKTGYLTRSLIHE